MIGAIATGVSGYNTVAPVIGDVWESVSNIFDGGSKVCPNEPSAIAVSYMLQSLTDSERAEMTRLYQAAGKPSPYSVSAQTFAHDMAGGDDCRVGSATGRAFSEYAFRMLSRYPQGMQVPTYSAQAADYPSDSDRPTIGSVVGSIWDDLKTAGGNVIGGAVEGAVSGATGAAQGAATGSNIGRSSVSAQTLLLIVAGFLVVFFLSKR